MAAEIKEGHWRPRGSIPPMVTPVEERGGTLRPDGKSIKRLSNHLIEGESDAIFGLGTTGEFREQTEEQKKETIDLLAESVNSRIPILVGVSSPTIKETESVTQYADSHGATAIVLTPLYGDGTPLDKLTAIKNSTGLPIVLYNNPDIHRGLSVPIEFVDQALADPQVVGMKDSSQDAGYKRELYRRQSPTFHVLEGQTPFMLSSLQDYDAAGIVNWLANPFPREVKTVFERRDQESVDDLLHKGKGLESIEKIKDKLVTQGIIKSFRLFPPRG